MNIFNSPVAKRTRLQRQLLAQGFNGSNTGCCGSSRCQSRKRHRESGSSQCVSRQEVLEIIDVDDYSIDKRASRKVTLNGLGGSSRSNRRVLSEDKRVDESLLHELEEEKSSENGSYRSTRRRLDETKMDKESLIDESEEETNNENASEGCNISSRRGHDEAERVNEILFDDSEEETNNENGSCILRRRGNDESESVNEILLDDSDEETNNENASKCSSVLRGKRHEEATSIDDDVLSVEDSEGKSNNENGSGSTYRSNSRLMTSNQHGEYSDDESQEKGSDEEESHHSMKGTDVDKGKNNIESTKIAMKNHAASFFTTGTHTYFLYSSDDSDSDDTAVIPDEEEADEDLPISCKYHQEIQNLSTDEDDEDEPSSSSESESEHFDNFEFLLPNKRPNQLINMKESPMKNTREKVWSGSVDRREKNHSALKTNMKKANVKPMNGSIRINTHEKTNAKDKASDRYTTVDKEINAVKDQESLKPRRAPRKDDGAFVDSLLDSIIANGDVHHKEDAFGDSLSLQFKFDDSEDESSGEKTDESDMEGLFQEMDFALTCEEIGSYTPPVVKNREKDVEETETNRFQLCKRGDHNDIYFEEQTGFRCGLCGAIVLESRYVIPKLANYAPDKSNRSYLFNQQQFSTSENIYFEAPDWRNPLDIYKLSKGTVWELIPTSIRVHLYHHQQEGFEFLWKNLAGTIELSRIHKLDPHGGGCIISHAPGTGKTLLTIVFLESFLKKFPKCWPVIVAPVSMLLTWEAEFKKWQVGFSFLNLNSSEILSKDNVVNGKLKCSKDLMRAMKISSWSNGGSVLGVSYSLYEKIVGNTKNKNLEKMADVLLDKPGLVVLDEGHTPRNERSKIWNVLKKLKTKKRVVLSGTPFQNNFRELFNTLHLVRPATAKDIMNQKIFAEMMIRHKNKKKSRSGSDSKDIEKLKAIISPFVHVHKGKILESKLQGLKSSVILLNPPPLQKRLIKNLGNSAKTFEYEHKVALVSVHPSLILHCSLSEKEKNSINIQELKKVKLKPDFGVKTKFVMELIRLSVSLDEKVLIFSQYIEPLKVLKDQIAHVFGWKEGREIMIIEGRIQHKQRQMIINDFNDPNSEVKVLLASTRCCSEGIHLIGASRVVLLDVVWNPSVERQAISRAYRLGQKKVVYTYHLMASGTTEEEKYDRQVEKERLGELVFSSSAMAVSVEEPKNNEKVHATKLNDKILQQMVDHQELNTMFKEIRYPEKQTTL